MPVRTRVGHSFIKQVMAETGAIFGGEHSAHYYFRDNWRADSGSIAALLVLEQLSRAGVPLSELRKPFERYVQSGEINSTRRRSARGDRARWPPSSRRARRTASTGSPSTAATGGSTCGRATPSRCCGSTSRPPTRPPCDAHTAEVLARVHRELSLHFVDSESAAGPARIASIGAVGGPVHEVERARSSAACRPACTRRSRSVRISLERRRLGDERDMAVIAGERDCGRGVAALADPPILDAARPSSRAEKASAPSPHALTARQTRRARRATDPLDVVQRVVGRGDAQRPGRARARSGAARAVRRRGSAKPMSATPSSTSASTSWECASRTATRRGSVGERAEHERHAPVARRSSARRPRAGDGARACWTTSTASSASAAHRCANGRSCSPAGVSVAPRVVRSKTCVPDDAFEMADALAHRRLAHEELVGGAAEAALPGDREEHLEVPEIECHKKSL